MRKIKALILFIHQLPQNIIGLIVYLWNFRSVKIWKKFDITYYSAKNIGNAGVSLGHFIFIDSDIPVTESDLKHEHGHQIQSLKLGWLYLFIVGLPSVTGNIYHRIAHNNWTPEQKIKWYYSQPVERWADNLGGVVR